VNAVNIIIDLDGTVYRGDRLVKHAKSFIEVLNQNSINYKCFTNCSKRVPKELAFVLNEMGLEIQEGSIITSGCITRDYVRRTNKQALVYVIGSTSLKEYLEVGNVKLVHGVEAAADYVVVGFCTDFTYYDLTYALWHIQRGAEFLATNIDDTIPDGDNIVPHTGAICAFLEYASKKKPLNFGKPSAHAGNYFRDIFGSNHVFVIGDRIDTDMLFALNNGFTGCLVLTGITLRQDAEKSGRNHFNVFRDLREFCEHIGYQI